MPEVSKASRPAAPEAAAARRRLGLPSRPGARSSLRRLAAVLGSATLVAVLALLAVGVAGALGTKTTVVHATGAGPAGPSRCPSLAAVPPAAGGAAPVTPPLPTPLPGTSTATHGGRSSTSVSVTVPAVAIALVDATGTPTAVETNTERPPGCSDLFFTTADPRATGMQPATLAQVDQVMALDRPDRGTWQPGWNSLSGLPTP